MRQFSLPTEASLEDSLSEREAWLIIEAYSLLEPSRMTMEITSLAGGSSLRMSAQMFSKNAF
jgi:hypothetical protein